jgi:hypothetical protein
LANTGKQAAHVAPFQGVGEGRTQKPATPDRARCRQRSGGRSDFRLCRRIRCGPHRIAFSSQGSAANRYFWTCCVPPPELMNVVSGDTMTNYPYIFFNKSPEQLRLVGARGGRAYGRSQRARLALGATPPQAVPRLAALPATTAESITVLDACFPWLRGAEKRRGS